MPGPIAKELLKQAGYDMVHTKRNGTMLSAPVLSKEPMPLLDISTLHPHVQALIQAIMDHASTLAKYRAGTVRLTYHREKVKASLELIL